MQKSVGKLRVAGLAFVLAAVGIEGHAGSRKRGLPPNVSGGLCLVVSNQVGPRGADLLPGDGAAMIYSLNTAHSAVAQGDIVADSMLTKVDLVEKPKHGQIIRRDGNSYGYKPNGGYVGTDRVGFVAADIQGQRVKATYNLRVVKEKLDAENFLELQRKHCPKEAWLVAYKLGAEPEVASRF